MQESLIQPYVYYLDKEGAKRACELGELATPRYITSKSRMIVNHDLEITKFHLSLETALNSDIHATKVFLDLHWQQWRDDLRDKVITPDGSKSIIPDAYFTIGDRAFFLEVVKSYESEYEGGRSNIQQKLSLYQAYRSRFQEKYGEIDMVNKVLISDFRVLWVLPTVKRVAMLLGKIEKEFPYRKFWFTDEASYQRDIMGKIWWTPKDFRTATYSLFEPKAE